MQPLARALAGSVVVIAIALSPLSAGAQTEPPDRSAIARSLFQEGVELARAERYADAADRFRRAQELRPAPAIAFNLASALTQLGELVEAAEILRSVQRAPDLTQQMRAAVDVLLEQITPRIARLTIRVEGDRRSVRIELDEHELAPAAIGIAVPIDPGAHVARALRDGDEIARAEADLAEGGSGELSLTIPEPRIEAALESTMRVDAAATDAPPSGGDDVWIWVGLGIGVVVAGAVVTATVVALQPGAAPMPVTGNTMPGVIEF